MSMHTDLERMQRRNNRKWRRVEAENALKKGKANDRSRDLANSVTAQRARARQMSKIDKLRRG
jgi:hypothetical protein